MKETVYVETSVISYLTARPGRDIIVLAHQEVTRQWWASARTRFELYVSEVVLDEAAMGDAEAAGRRTEVVRALPFLDITPEVQRLATVYAKRLHFPPKAQRDALHLALAVVHGMDYFVTWNCAHLANAAVIRRYLALNTDLGFPASLVCTPDELLEEAR